MCWMAVSIEDLSIKTAKVDIEVYKVVTNATINSCQSLIMAYKYDNNIQPKIPLKINGLIYNINEGYHSYARVQYKTDKHNVKLMIAGHNRYYLNGTLIYCFVAKFIIPKGSKYYKNAFDEIVSDTIKYTGEYFKLENYK